MKISQILSGILLVLLISICAEAQSVQPGIKLGLNLANIHEQNSDGNKMKAGVIVGGVLHMPISEKFAFQPELLFVQQGTRGKEDGTAIRFNNNYLMLPLMGKYYFLPSVALQVGPQVGLLLNSKLKGKSSGVGVSVDSKELYKTLDFGVNMGLSYEYSANFVGVMQYSIGLANIAEEAFGGVSLRNYALQFSLAYRFVYE